MTMHILTPALPGAYCYKGVRRYGFHGLSYEYVTGKLKEAAPCAAAGRAVIAHLGAGAKECLEGVAACPGSGCRSRNETAQRHSHTIAAA